MPHLRTKVSEKDTAAAQLHRVMAHGIAVFYLSSGHPLPVSSYKPNSDTRFLLAGKIVRYIHSSQGNNAISCSFDQHCLTRSDKRVSKGMECSWVGQKCLAEQALASCTGWVYIPACRCCCLPGFPTKCLKVTNQG